MSPQDLKMMFLVATVSGSFFKFLILYFYCSILFNWWKLFLSMTLQVYLEYLFIVIFDVYLQSSARQSWSLHRATGPSEANPDPEHFSPWRRSFSGTNATQVSSIEIFVETCGPKATWLADVSIRFDIGSYELPFQAAVQATIRSTQREDKPKVAVSKRYRGQINGRKSWFYVCKPAKSFTTS